MRIVVPLLFLCCLLLLAPAAPAQRMPPPSEVKDWISPHNLNRLKADQQALPPYKFKKLPDGSEEKPRAPWPFLILVSQSDSDGLRRIEDRVLADARIVLSTRLIKLVRITPDRVLDLKYLQGVRGLKDPSLIFVNRDFQVVGTVTDPKKFEERGVVPLLSQTADPEYPVKLTAFLGQYMAMMKEEEALWISEKKVTELLERSVKSTAARREKLESEAQALEEEVEEARDRLLVREQEILSRLVPTEPEAEALPTTFGSGRNARPLTPEEMEAIAAYKDFARNDNPHVRSAAVEDLGLIDSGAMVEFILLAAKDVDDRVVAAAGRALGRMRSDEALEGMLAGLQAGDARSRRAAILGFAHVKRTWPQVVPALVPFLSDSNEDLRFAALQALSRQHDPVAVAPLCKALDDTVPALRVMAAQALGALRDAKAVPPLLARLNDSDWSLRKAVIEALGVIRSRDSIVPLLERFEKEEGLLVENLYQALVSVTGQDFSIRPEFWRRWWDRYGEGFEVPSDAEVAEAKERARKSMEKYTGPGVSNYHTISTLSRSMLFVIDVSASMRDKIPIPPGTPKAKVDALASRVKMDIAKDELIALLASLEPNVRFNIIAFAGEVDSWKNSMVGMGSRSAAIKYVAKLEAMQPTRGNRRGAGAGGGDEQKTNTYGALMAAFGLAGSGGEWKKRTDADTIFFVTDGLPTTGEIADVSQLIETFTDINRTRGLVLHLIMFDAENAKLLGPLATRNGGRCVVRGFDTEDGNGP